MYDGANLIVIFWLLPVTLQIIIPLLMLWTWGLLKLFMWLKIGRNVTEKNDNLNDVLIQTKKS